MAWLVRSPPRPAALAVALLCACVTVEPSPLPEAAPPVDTSTPAPPLTRHEVRVDDHPLVVWSKAAPDP